MSDSTPSVTERHLEAGEILIKEQDYGDEAYLIRSGSVAIFRVINGENMLLATLGQGEIVGEMALIDERPRSATVVAAEATDLLVIKRKKFFQLLQEDPDLSIELLKVLFERLRSAQQKLVHLKLQSGDLCTSDLVPPAHWSNASGCDTPSQESQYQIHIIGDSERARNTLPPNGLIISEFPFLIGRKSDDPLVRNDLAILDHPPFQISRSHASLHLEDGHPAISDRGSHLGLEINDIVLGGRDGQDDPMPLKPGRNVLCLGGEDSPYWFLLDVKQI